MAGPFSRAGTALVLAAALASTASALAAAPAERGPAVVNSALDAPLFYQLLVGELELREGQAGTAYQVFLEAARRSRNEELFRRATDIALQGRAGEQALTAVKAWRAALPGSLEALRYNVQLLVALNRTGDLPEPLSALLQTTPAAQRPGLIASLPRFFARSTDRQATAKLLEQTLQPYLATPGTQTAARVAIGRAWLAAADSAKAFDDAQRAHKLDPTADDPAILALELLPTTPAAEAIVTDQLQARPDSNTVRVMYVRTLTGMQRYADAAAQLETLTSREPKLAAPWLTLGALRLEMRQPADATAALQTYVALAQGGAASAASAASAAGSAPAAAATNDIDDSAASDRSNDGLTQAWRPLAQAASTQHDYPAAEAWLARIDNPQRALEVQSRRASLLASQGKLAEARELIRRVPEQTAADARAKLLAESQLLREQKQWGQAEQVLNAANQRFPDDADLLYEQAMMDEKLDRLDDMERLLRRVIELKPDNPQAYNALGYSLADRSLRLPEARSLVAKALELSPGEPFITDSMGWVEYRLGNTAEALRLLRQAYKARPDPEIAAHLGEVLWQSDQHDEARSVWREGRSRDSGNDVLRETLARLRVDL